MKLIISIVALVTIAFVGGLFFGYSFSNTRELETTAFYEGMYYGCLETASALAGVPMFSESEPFARISVSCGMQINQAMQHEVHRHWVR